MDRIKKLFDHDPDDDDLDNLLATIKANEKETINGVPFYADPNETPPPPPAPAPHERNVADVFVDWRDDAQKQLEAAEDVIEHQQAMKLDADLKRYSREILAAYEHGHITKHEVELLFDNPDIGLKHMLAGYAPSYAARLVQTKRKAR